MKIRTDQYGVLGTQESQPTAPQPETRTSFEDLLSQEVEKSASSTSAAGTLAPPPGAKVLGLSPLLEAQDISPTQPPSETEQKVMQHIDSLLNKWDTYAQALKTPAAGDDLRQAYGYLANIQSEVQELKGAAPNLGVEHPRLKSMVDELEILTVTEQFKFNRGDYL